MEKKPHTLGPWRWSKSQRQGSRHLQMLNADDRTIVYHDAHWLPTAADRNVIAAAPDLLAALRGLLEDGAIDQALMEPGRVSAARAAIRKATHGV